MASSASPEALPEKAPIPTRPKPNFSNFTPIGTPSPGPIRIQKPIPAKYVGSYRDLLAIAAILVFIPWAIRLYNQIGDANGISEDSLSNLQTSNSISMFQICTQLSKTLTDIDCTAILSGLKLPEPLSSALAQDESQSSSTTASSNLPTSRPTSSFPSQSGLSASSSCVCSPTPPPLASPPSETPTTFSTAFSTTLSLNQSSSSATVTETPSSLIPRQLPASSTSQPPAPSTSDASNSISPSNTGTSSGLTLEQEIGILIATVLGSLSIAISLNFLWSNNSITPKVGKESWGSRLQGEITAFLLGRRRALITAAYAGDIGNVRPLLEKRIGFDVDAISDALEAAAYGGNEMVLRLLLERKGSLLSEEENKEIQPMVSKSVIHALYTAVFAGDNAVSKPFIRALCAASFAGNSNLIPYLIAKVPWEVEYDHRRAAYREILRTIIEGGNMDYVRRTIEVLVQIEGIQSVTPKLSERRDEIQGRISDLEGVKTQLEGKHDQSGLGKERKDEFEARIQQIVAHVTELKRRVKKVNDRTNDEEMNNRYIQEFNQRVERLRVERNQELNNPENQGLVGDQFLMLQGKLSHTVEDPIEKLQTRIQEIQESRLEEYKESTRQELYDEVTLVLQNAL